MKKLSWICVFIVSSSLSVMGYAQQMNERKYIPPGSAAKVQRYLAKPTGSAEDPVDPSLTGQGECGVNLGSPTIKPGQRPPKEVITVIKGDVINVCKRR